jgi:zinc protease
MKRNLFITFISVLVLGLSSFAQELGLDPKLKTGKLPNGLTYYIRENAKPEKKVELRLVVNAGSVMEDDDQQGLAHMAEHMAFNGTKNFKKNDLISFLQSIGVEFGNDLNAYTGFDETVYILPIPTDKTGNLEKGFQILEDWAHQVTYLDEDINNERAIILEESRSRKSANDRMLKTILPELLKGSRYANRLPIGVDSIIAGFKPDAIRRFYRDWYRPDLMAVIVVGDIRQADALALIEKHFAGIRNPASPRPRTLADVPPYAASNALVVTDKEATGYNFSLNYPSRPVQPTRTESQYRDELVKSLYTSMLNARFRELTQKENPPFVFASAGFGGIARNYEGFSVSAGTGTNNIRKGIDAASEEIERVKRYGFTEAELQRAKKNLITSYENSYNNRDKTESEDFAQEYISHFTQQEPQPGIDWEYAYVKKTMPSVSLAEVNKVTDLYRNEKNRFAYITGPEGQQTLPTSAEVLAAVDAKQSADLKPYEEKAVASNLLSQAPKAGKVVSTTPGKNLGTTELKLSNGITVTLKRTDFKADQVLMGAYRWGGNGSYGVNDKITAENTIAVISSMGIGTFSPLDLRKALAGKTANVAPYLTDDSEGFRGSSSNKDIESMLQLMYLYVTEPRTDTALFRSFIQRNKSQYALIASNPQAAFIDTVYRVLYNDNPLAPTAVPKSENFDKIDLNRAKGIYKERMGDMSGMHFIFVGSFSQDSIVPLIEKYVASLPASGAKTNYTDNKVRPFRGNKNITVKKGKDDKSLIVAFLSGETPYSEEKSYSLQALSEVMNIKITEEMREKIQGIYSGGTFADLSRTPYNGYQFALQLPCGPAKVDTLIKAFNAEMQALADKGPEQGYVDKVRKQWIEQYRTNIKTNEYWLGRLQQIRQGNMSADRLLNFEKYANALKPADIQGAAKMVMSSPSRLIAVQMPDK